MSGKTDKKIELEQWLKWKLRQISYRWPGRYEAMRNARVERGLYRCNICSRQFKNKEVQLDHIVPVVNPSTGFLDFNEYIKRMFVEADGFQVVCKPCHKIKTDKENSGRTRKKKGKKK